MMKTGPGWALHSCEGDFTVAVAADAHAAVNSIASAVVNTAIGLATALTDGEAAAPALATTHTRLRYERNR
jgi:hypothetical protein